MLTRGACLISECSLWRSLAKLLYLLVSKLSSQSCLPESSLTLTCSTLWIGDRVGRLERACMRTVLNHCGRLVLYCYRLPEGIPDGIETADAAAIIPADQIIRYRNGSYSLFSNRFRYELQRRALGTWVDTDLYMLRPLEDRQPYLLAEEANGILNPAVLRIPADSAILPQLLEPFVTDRVPPWLPLRQRLRARWFRLIRGKTDLAGMPWGTTGPRALTAAVGAARLAAVPYPPAAFFPAPWQEASWIADPTRHPEEWIGAQTIAIHLWNERIRQFKDDPAPPGSFLARLQREGA